MVSMSPNHIAALITAKPEGITLIDASVSGAMQADRQVQLLNMAGCTPREVQNLDPFFDAVGKRAIYLDRACAGAVMKLAFNALLHGLNQSVSESLTLPEAAGIDPETAFDVVETRAVAAPMLLYRRALCHDEAAHDGTFILALARNDMEVTAALARRIGVIFARDAGAMAQCSSAGLRRAGYGCHARLHANGKIMKAALFVGGWECRAPTAFADWCRPLPDDNRFHADVYDTMEPLERTKDLTHVDLIPPIWSSARSSHRDEFGNMTKRQEDDLLKLIGADCGIAGWHGDMGDPFRDRPSDHFLIGGQCVAYPPGWPDNLQPPEEYIDYDVTICKPDDPIVQGIKSFRLTSEQYYILVDPSNEILTTTAFSSDHRWWIGGTVIPVVWKRNWDKGSVFHCSIGHQLDELNVAQVPEILCRDALQASSGANEDLTKH